MRRRFLTPFLICALLALPGCGDALKHAVARVAGGDGAKTADARVEESESAPVAEAEPEPAAGESSGPGFYKVVEPNGTVRFVGHIDEVPTTQRTNAARLAMERSNDPDKPKRRTPARRATQQLAAAKSPPPPAAPAAPAPAGE